MNPVTYGSLTLFDGQWHLTGIPPHVAIRLKQLFPRIPAHQVGSYALDNTSVYCADICWFMERYPLTCSKPDLRALRKGRKAFKASQQEIEDILTSTYERPDYVGLQLGQRVRTYQSQAIEVAHRRKALLLADVVGLGKTYAAAAFGLVPGTLPMAVVVQSHLPSQWVEKITEFTSLRVHVIKNSTPYTLPPADIYIFKYTILSGWCDIFATRFFVSVVFDEIQELRTGPASEKGKAAYVLADHAEYKMGLSATPIYGYGGEIWNIYRALEPDVLGSECDFRREWCTQNNQGKWLIRDTNALGSYLREQHVLLRRTKKDAGQEVPPVNMVPKKVASDGAAVKSIEALARTLARKVVGGSFLERGQASRELDMLVRQATGIGKARAVAAYAKLFLEQKIPILLVGWHREVYEIWLKELHGFNPVMYTGSESPRQKDESKRAFLAGETDCFILSLRSGAGLDGLQERCSTAIIGELDWSKKILEQVCGRLDREGQTEQVMALVATSDDGSDPPMLDLLAIKESQSSGVMDPGKTGLEEQNSDDSRIRLLAAQYLKTKALAA